MLDTKLHAESLMVCHGDPTPTARDVLQSSMFPPPPPHRCNVQGVACGVQETQNMRIALASFLSLASFRKYSIMNNKASLCIPV